MLSERDRYRNPLPPVGYVQTGEPKLVQKKATYEDDTMYILMQELLDAKVYDIPDITTYEELVFSPSSDDEIEEVPFVPVPKIVDILDITEENDEPNINPLVSIKKERVSPEPPVVTKDSVQTAESETQERKKKYKKTRRRKKSKHQYKSCSSDSDSSSESCGNDSDSKEKPLGKSDISDGSRSPPRKKENYVSKRKSRNKNHHRKRNHSSSSDSCSRRRRKRSSSHRSRSGSQHRHKKGYDSYSYDERYFENREMHSYKKFHTKDERQFHIQEDGTDSISYKDSQHLDSSSSIVHKDLPEEISHLKLEPNSLYGDYYCTVCNINANNLITYESHLKGKKHKKNVEKQQKEAQREDTFAKLPHLAEEQSSNDKQMVLPNPQLTSKYPEPPAGYTRQKLDATSAIQSLLDNAKFPCPGQHKVKEIIGPTETVYYCGICDCNCSYNSIMQHLGGFKHQLNSLKYYRSELYEKWSYSAKYRIQDKVIEVLYKEEEKNGKGFVQVEKDVRVSDTQNVKTVRTDESIYNQPSTSYQSVDTEFLENYKFNSLPDPTKSGYYCKLCDSHSNSESMWNAHIIGKRHLANVKKNPGLGPSKSKYIRAESDVKPILFKIIERENEDNLPIVGLSQIREIRKPDINGLLFNCFSCGACVSSLDILNHILSMKHREKYLNSIKHPEMETLNDMPIPESCKSSIIEEICSKVEKEEGRGKPDVFYSKR